MTVDQQPAPKEPKKPAGAGAAVATAAPPAPGEPKEPPAFLRLVKRLPFTTFYVVVTMLLAIGFTTLWNGIEELSIYPDVAYGLPAFEDGRWLTLIWGNFFALNPVFYIYVAGAFAFLTGFSEWMLGTKRTIVICVVYQFAAVLLTALLFLIFRNPAGNGPRSGPPRPMSASRPACWPCQRGQRDRPAAVAAADAAGHLGLRAVLHRLRRADGRRRARHRGRAEHAVLLPAGRPARPEGTGPADPPRDPAARHGRGPAHRRGEPDRRLRTRPADPVRARRGRARDLVGDADHPGDLAAHRERACARATGWPGGSRSSWPASRLRWWPWSRWSRSSRCSSPDADVTFDEVPQFIANAVLYLGFLLLLILGRRAFRVPRRSKRRLASGTSQPELARELLHKWGGDTISWMTTWPENRHMVTADGQSYLAFRKHAGVAVALGDPVGPPGSATRDDQRFRPAVRQGGDGAVHLLLQPVDRRCHRRARLAERPGRRGQPDRPAGAGVQGQEVAGHPDRAEQGAQGGRHIPDGHPGRRVVGGWSGRWSSCPRSGWGTRSCRRWASPSAG